MTYTITLCALSAHLQEKFPENLYLLLQIIKSLNFSGAYIKMNLIFNFPLDLQKKACFTALGQTNGE